MTRNDVLRLLEETLDLGGQRLTGDEALRDLEGWDSLSALMVLAAIDKRFGLPLRGQQVIACRTVADLVRLLGAGVGDRAA